MADEECFSGGVELLTTVLPADDPDAALDAATETYGRGRVSLREYTAGMEHLERLDIDYLS